METLTKTDVAKIAQSNLDTNNSTELIKTVEIKASTTCSDGTIENHPFKLLLDTETDAVIKNMTYACKLALAAHYVIEWRSRYLKKVKGDDDKLHIVTTVQQLNDLLNRNKFTFAISELETKRIAAKPKTIDELIAEMTPAEKAELRKRLGG